MSKFFNIVKRAFHVLFGLSILFILSAFVGSFILLCIAAVAVLLSLAVVIIVLLLPFVVLIAALVEKIREKERKESNTEAE